MQRHYKKQSNTIERGTMMHKFTFGNKFKNEVSKLLIYMNFNSLIRKTPPPKHIATSILHTVQIL